MRYKYTQHNLFDKPTNYMYSKFEGIEFLLSYINDRNKFIIKNINENEMNQIIFSHYKLKFYDLKIFETTSIIDTKKLLNSILWHFYQKIRIKDCLHILNWFCQRYEVSKKLKKKYKSKSKFLFFDFKDLEIYIMFSIILLFAYDKSKNIKYLNTFLKVNDLILSSINFILISSENKKIISYLILNEIKFIKVLISNNGIKLK